MTSNGRFIKLSGNTLKLIALAAMTIDHIGVQIFTDVGILRIIGRLAFPIFAYMIAEGCTYTRNKTRYLVSVGVVAILCQTVYFVAMQSLYQCIFVTFFLSIILIYSADYALKSGKAGAAAVAVIAFAAVIFITEYLPVILKNTDFYVDYGFFGVLVPVLVYFAKGKGGKLFATFIGLSLLAYACGSIQWYSLLALPLIALYSGERGKLKLKWFFYIYYPLHLGVIYLVSTVI